MSYSHLNGFDKIGVSLRCIFNVSKACSHSWVHSNFFLHFNTLKNEAHLSLDLDTNLFSMATRPTKLCTSLDLFGDSISNNFFIFSGLVSIPLWWMTKPKIFPAFTPKVHLSGFNFIPYFLPMINIWSMWRMWSLVLYDFTNMLLTYTSIVFPILVTNIMLTSLR